MRLKNSSGGAVFFNLGIPFIGGELLLGYRQNNIEYKNYQSQISGRTVTLADPVKITFEPGKCRIRIYFLKIILYFYSSTY